MSYMKLGLAALAGAAAYGASHRGHRAEYVGHHMVTEDGAVYVDTAFLNTLKQINLSLDHSGFGDFYLPDFGEGRVDFRRTYQEGPKAFSGRTHLVRDASGGKRIKQIIRQMEKAGASVEV